jgi:hypothetical protein
MKRRLRLAAKISVYFLRFAAMFCWFFSVMVGLTTLQSQNTIEIILKGIVVGVGAWCGWGLLNRRSQAILYALGLCFYALFGSLVWIYYSLLIPYIYEQNIAFGVYEYLAFIYIFCAGVIIKFLLGKNVKRYFVD